VAKFTVLTHDNRNLVIEADRFVPTNTDYTFSKDNHVVASVPFSPNLFAVVDQEVEGPDFYFADHSDDDTFGLVSDEDETDDVCLDCRIAEFLNTQEGFNAVADIVYTLLEPDENEPEGAEVTD
jgi:hypothetical protein